MRAAIVISVGIAAIAASGSAACAAIIGLLNGEGISALGLNAIGATLAGSMVATMGYADATQAYGNIYYGLLGSDDEVAHIIIDNIEFLRNDPELYYLFEAMATLGTAEAPRMFEINYGIYLSNRESNILEKASYKNKEESEPGTWETVNEAMSQASRDYQRFVTGAEDGMVYKVNGVKFDGYKDGVLIEAKGNYSQFVNQTTGKFQT